MYGTFLATILGHAVTLRADVATVVSLGVRHQGAAAHGGHKF